jgi:selenocysteine lyase/cysteine desulfurase
LYVRRECARALKPLSAGWLSHEEPDGFLQLGAGHLRYDRPLKQTARVFEGSAQNVLGCAALDASLELLLGLGIENIFAHVQRYHDRLEPALLERGFESLRSREPARRSGTLGFKAPAGIDAIALHQSLVQSGISCALPDGVLRMAPHWPNNLGEVPKIIERVDAALGAQR